MKRSTRVPAEPFARLLREYMAEQGEDYQITNLETELSFNPRTIYRILNEEGQIDFSTADTIVTRLFGPSRWIVDKELAEIYQSVDLRRLDLTLPLDTAKQKSWARKQFVEAYERLGTIALVSRELGIPPTTVGQRLRDYGVC
jgi:hypothetical protein